jgi:hypothetical protein
VGRTGGQRHWPPRLPKSARLRPGTAVGRSVACVGARGGEGQFTSARVGGNWSSPRRRGLSVGGRRVRPRRRPCAPREEQGLLIGVRLDVDQGKTGRGNAGRA